MTELTFLQLQKNTRKPPEQRVPWRFAVLGDCATQHLAAAIKGFAYTEGYALELFDADYDQVLAQVMDAGSELYAFAPKTILLHLCTEKLYEAFCHTPAADRAAFAQQAAARITGYWAMIAAHSSASILHFTFVAQDDRVFGNFALKTPVSFAWQLQKLNGLLAEACQQQKNVFLIDLNEICAALGRRHFHDAKLYYIAKMPISTEALPAVAEAVTATLKALDGRLKKCVILDLDNTLWGGVIGDDGMDGIQIGELGLGHAFSELQLWLKELKKRGILLCVCSKNNEDTAKEPFLHHPEMVLRLEDFSLFVANWEDKASNIRAMQQTLNIGMDSIVFIDDNPFEREAVRALLPGITVPALPEDPALYLETLQALDLFETVSYSEEDADRTAQYQAEAGRTALQQQFASYDEYLQSLHMAAVAAPFDSFHFPRIAQLTQRSNQFNLRTVRYTEAQIAQLAADPRYLTLYFCLRDTFGDHGLISVVILEKQENSTLFVHEWLMSCRVLKRGMEEFIVNKMLETARAGGFARVVGEYIQTPKNAMVQNIYARLGFAARTDGLFEASVDQFVPNKTYIMEESV